jgi:hypothetical protein
MILEKSKKNPKNITYLKYVQSKLQKKLKENNIVLLQLFVMWEF